MTVANKSLVLDLLESLSTGPRSYVEVMDAWRTSCPRFPVWEDATDLGFVRAVPDVGGTVVELTATGKTFLASERPATLRRLIEAPE